MYTYIILSAHPCTYAHAHNMHTHMRAHTHTHNNNNSENFIPLFLFYDFLYRKHKNLLKYF